MNKVELIENVIAEMQMGHIPEENHRKSLTFERGTVWYQISRTTKTIDGIYGCSLNRCYTGSPIGTELVLSAVRGDEESITLLNSILAWEERKDETEERVDLIASIEETEYITANDLRTFLNKMEIEEDGR